MNAIIKRIAGGTKASAAMDRLRYSDLHLQLEQTAAARDCAVASLEMIALMPRQARARRLASATIAFLEANTKRA